MTVNLSECVAKKLHARRIQFVINMRVTAKYGNKHNRNADALSNVIYGICTRELISHWETTVGEFKNACTALDPQCDYHDLDKRLIEVTTNAIAVLWKEPFQSRLSKKQVDQLRQKTQSLKEEFSELISIEVKKCHDAAKFSDDYIENLFVADHQENGWKYHFRALRRWWKQLSFRKKINWSFIVTLLGLVITCIVNWEKLSAFIQTAGVAQG